MFIAEGKGTATLNSMKYNEDGSKTNVTLESELLTQQIEAQPYKDVSPMSKTSLKTMENTISQNN